MCEREKERCYEMRISVASEQIDSYFRQNRSNYILLAKSKESVLLAVCLETMDLPGH